MAEIVDVESVEPESGEIQQTQEVQPEAVIPEKLKGKSPEEIAKAYLESEKLMTRATQEASEAKRESAELRRLTDELLKSQIGDRAKAETPKAVDYFENPQEAVRQTVESNPRILEVERQTNFLRMEQAKRSLIEKHPDVTEIVRDEGFIDWVKQSPIRTQLFGQANAYDVTAADELLGTWKQLRGAKAKVEDVAEKKSRDATLASVAVDAGGAGEGSRKVFRRADLINLKIRDPQKYAAMEDEIMAAYQEGRVR